MNEQLKNLKKDEALFNDIRKELSKINITCVDQYLQWQINEALDFIIKFEFKNIKEIPIEEIYIYNSSGNDNKIFKKTIMNCIKNHYEEDSSFLDELKCSDELIGRIRNKLEEENIMFIDHDILYEINKAINFINEFNITNIKEINIAGLYTRNIVYASHPDVILAKITMNCIKDMIQN